jgi:bacterioferritin-associated ferredoxin
MLTENGGMPVKKALKLTPGDIIARLSGLPSRKIHCSLFGEKALQAAINDYFRKSSQEHRIPESGTKIVDKTLGITEKEIEQAVLEGATTLDEVQKKTKAGTTDKSCIPEIMRLIGLYSKKYRRE